MFLMYLIFDFLSILYKQIPTKMFVTSTDMFEISTERIKISIPMVKISSKKFQIRPKC